jgi:uncharacterized protein (DUF433 family)
MNKLDYFHPDREPAGSGPLAANPLMTEGDSTEIAHEHEPHWDSETAWRIVIKSASARSARSESWFAECAKWADEALQKSVEIDPKRRGGVPVLKGTRFTVGQTLAELADSTGVPEVAERFDLDEETIREMLYGLSLLAEKPRP